VPGGGQENEEARRRPGGVIWVSKYAACAQKYKIQQNGCRGASVPCTKYAACAQKWAQHRRAPAKHTRVFGSRATGLVRKPRRRPGGGQEKEEARRRPGGVTGATRAFLDPEGRF